MRQVQAVVKVGGSLSGVRGALRALGAALAEGAQTVPLVVMPGGGPFADVVRAYDHRTGLSPDSAHWMAILGMDQFAYALLDVIPGAALALDRSAIEAAIDRHRVPVLAPYRWLRETDALPHTWEVTSDSLAAYLAGILGAKRLVLLKPVDGTVESLTDPYFRQALPDGLKVRSVGPSGWTRWREYLLPNTGS
ncbi:MAG TPA: hypothetical protein VLT17_04065 [Gemmatimonadales bacterium]|jgi:dihydroneopterin aldolase|nr:hypothetical protein [Gemmatimonadales bacterium]